MAHLPRPLDEISQLHTIDAVLQFCNVVGTDEVTTTRGAFLAASGAVGTAPLRVLGVISEEDYLAGVEAIRIACGTVDASTQIAPNLVPYSDIVGDPDSPGEDLTTDTKEAADAIFEEAKR